MSYVFSITAQQGKLGAEQAHAAIGLGLATHQHLPRRPLCWRLFAGPCPLAACGLLSNVAASAAAARAMHGSAFVPRCVRAVTYIMCKCALSATLF